MYMPNTQYTITTTLWDRSTWSSSLLKLFEDDTSNTKFGKTSQLSQIRLLKNAYRHKHWIVAYAVYTCVLLRSRPKADKSKLEKVAIIATYCHLRPSDAIAFPTKFLGFQIWAADEPNAVSSRVAVGRHVNATGCAMDWDKTK